MTEIPSILRLEPAGDNRYAVDNLGDAAVNPVVFGGQLLAQMITAAGAHSPGKTVKTIHTTFARAARVDADTELIVDTFHSGRAFASHTITAVQGDRVCARAQVLTDADEPDLIEHHDAAPALTAPTGDGATGHSVFPGGEFVIADDVDLVDSAAPVGPPELTIWYRSLQTPDEPLINQAVLSWGTDGFLIGTAMRPHAGLGYDRAHVDVSTGVIGHTLTFHRPFSMSGWLLMQHEAPFAGGGRSYGRCHIFDSSGALVASYIQDNMIRAMPEGQAGKGM